MTFAKDLQEMMNAWDLMMAEAKRQFPNASEELLYDIVSVCMKHSLKVK